MSRRNSSHVSNSRAGSISFRENDLTSAGVFFKSRTFACPSHLAEWRDALCSIPAIFKGLDKREEYASALEQLDGDEQMLYHRALEKCTVLEDATIDDCALRHEREWMREVSEPVLSVFLQAKRERRIASTEDYTWTLGQELTNIHSAETLYDPKPDYAFGIRPLQCRERNLEDLPALSKKALEALRTSSVFSLQYSPSQRREIAFPAIVYEAKSDSNPILWAENQAAVGAARALGILAELARLSDASEMVHVVTITSAGSKWQFHMAFHDSEGDIVGWARGRIRTK